MRVRVYDPALDAARRTPSPGETYVEITPDFEIALKFAEEGVAQDPSLCREIYGFSARGKYEDRPRASKEMLGGLGRWRSL
jgi:hypothetical protein